MPPCRVSHKDYHSPHYLCMLCALSLSPWGAAGLLRARRYFETEQHRAQGAKEDMVDAGLGGVLLGGNYVAGVALGKCVEYGYEYAREIAAYLQDEKSAAQTNTEGDAFFV